MILMNDVPEFNAFEVGQRIQQLRVEKGIKSIDMAAVLELHKDVYSRIENGRCICRIDKLYQIAQYLDASVDYILTGDREKEDMREIGRLLVNKQPKEIQKAVSILQILLED